MEQLQALKEMAEKVEAGGAGGTRVFAKTFGLRPDNRHLMAWGAYNGSLDSAKALHEAVLPGWSWSVTRGKHVPCAIVQGELMAGQHAEAENDTPARAWLLAILRAKINELEEV